MVKMLLVFTTFHNSTLNFYDIVSMTYIVSISKVKHLYSLTKFTGPKRQVEQDLFTTGTYNDYLKVKIKITVCLFLINNDT